MPQPIGKILVACLTKNVSIVQKCLDSGENVDWVDKQGQGAQHWVCAWGCLPIARVQLDHQFSTAQRDLMLATPLLHACKGGHADVAQQLLERQASVDECNVNAMFPQHAACHAQSMATVQLLVEHGARVDVQDSDGNTPLLVAFKTKQYVIGEYQLQNGANGGVFNEDSVTIALQLAQERQFEQLLKYAMIYPTVDLNIISESGDSVLSQLLQQCMDEDLLRKLFTHGLTQKQQVGRYFNALHFAVSNKRTSLIKLLLEYGAEVDARDGRGITALQQAIWTEDVFLLELQLEAHADPNLCAQNGESPLQVALTRMPKIATLLLHFGANPNLFGQEKESPLLLACDRLLWDVLDEIVQKGAKQSVRDENGRSALHLMIGTREIHQLEKFLASTLHTLHNQSNCE